MNKIRLGLSATLSGVYSLQGIDSLNGLILWSEYQNSLGGITFSGSRKNIPVELVYYDDESNVEKTREITKKLITDDKVDILLGPYSSSLSLASAQVGKSHARVLWNYGGSTDEIFSEDYPDVVSFIAPASRYFCPYLEMIKSMDGSGGIVAIVYARDSGFSTQVATGAINYSKKLGIQNIVYTYLSGKDGFSDIVKDLREKGIKDIIGVGRFYDDLAFARYLVGTGACLPGASIEEFNKELGKDSECFCSISQWEPGVNLNIDFGPDSGEFTELYLARFGKVPDYTSAQSFNMGNILTHFMEKLETVDENELKKEIISSCFTTFYGEFSTEMNTSFQNGHKTVVTQWQNGKKEVIFPPALSTSTYKEP